MHTMVTEFHQVGPLRPDRLSTGGEFPPAQRDQPDRSERPDQSDVQAVPEDTHPREQLLLQLNTFLVAHRWSPDMVHVQYVVTPIPGDTEAVHQVLVTHPAVAT